MAVAAGLAAPSDAVADPPEATDRAATADGGAPPALRHPFEAVNPRSAAAQKFIAWVGSGLKKPQYRLSAFHAALAYRLTGDKRFAELSALLFRKVQSAAEEARVQGKPPRIAFDSYLHVSRDVEDLLFPLVWCPEAFTPEETEWAREHARQAVWNVWHHKEATWWGTKRAWSGWSTSNPGNNYHYSFLYATCCWALYSGEAEWLDFLRNDKFPKLLAAVEELTGGGSREGTGYGLSHSRLFAIYELWKGATGEDLASRTPHCRQTIDYWLHATLPGGKFIAAIGDQSRVSEGPVYDYHRSLLAVAVAAQGQTEEARRGQWWLTRVYPRMRDGFNLQNDLWAALPAASVQEQPPTALSHVGAGGAHYFARSGWDAGASWLGVVGGPTSESHAHENQGAFDFWGAGGWLASTQNMRCKSGIQQATDWHNMLRFEQEGKLIKQIRRTAAPLQWRDSGEEVTATCDLSAQYAVPLTWTRRLTYRRPDRLTVVDECRVPEGVAATWQLQLPSEPKLSADWRTITAGKLRCTIASPANAEVTVRDWKELNPKDCGKGGWRLELTSRDLETRYEVVLEVAP